MWSSHICIRHTNLGKVSGWLSSHFSSIAVVSPHSSLYVYKTQVWTLFNSSHLYFILNSLLYSEATNKSDPPKSQLEASKSYTSKMFTLKQHFERICRLFIFLKGIPDVEQPIEASLTVVFINCLLRKVKERSNRIDWRHGLLQSTRRLSNSMFDLRNYSAHWEMFSVVI